MPCDAQHQPCCGRCAVVIRGRPHAGMPACEQAKAIVPATRSARVRAGYVGEPASKGTSRPRVPEVWLPVASLCSVVLWRSLCVATRWVRHRLGIHPQTHNLSAATTSASAPPTLLLHTIAKCDHLCRCLEEPTPPWSTTMIRTSLARSGLRTNTASAARSLAAVRATTGRQGRALSVTTMATATTPLTVFVKGDPATNKLLDCECWMSTGCGGQFVVMDGAAHLVVGQVQGIVIMAGPSYLACGLARGYMQQSGAKGCGSPIGATSASASPPVVTDHSLACPIGLECRWYWSSPAAAATAQALSATACC